MAKKNKFLHRFWFFFDQLLRFWRKKPFRTILPLSVSINRDGPNQRNNARQPYHTFKGSKTTHFLHYPPFHCLVPSTLHSLFSSFARRSWKQRYPFTLFTCFHIYITTTSHDVFLLLFILLLLLFLVGFGFDCVSED